MNESECKLVVQSFFENNAKFEKHLDNKQLVLNGKGYRIQPDDAYIFAGKVVVIECESKRLPVESISKYWWLFLKTDWFTKAMKLKCCFFLLRKDINEIRKDSVLILGKELVTKYPMAFEFRCLLPEQISENNIKNLLKNTLK